MDLKELETFIRVADLKSFSKTAIELNVTQPTITNHIQSLEKELDTILVNRKGRNISLTDSGQILYRYAIDILNSCDMAKHELNAHENTIVGHLNLEASSIPRQHLLPKLLHGFLDENKEVTFSISGNDTNSSLQKIKNRQLDLAIVSYRTDDEDLDFIKILEEELVVIVPNNFPYENYSQVDRDIFLNNKLLLKENSPEVRSIIFKGLKEVGINKEDIQVGGFCEDIEGIKNLVSLGLGISVITAKDARDDVELGKYKAVYIDDENMYRDFYFVYPNDRYLSPINEMFKSYILKYIKENSMD